MDALTHFFKGFWIYSNCFGLLTCQGAFRNQSETTRTLNEPWGTSTGAKKGLKFTTKKIIFKGDSSLDKVFVRVMGETHRVLYSSNVRVHDAINHIQWGLHDIKKNASQLLYLLKIYLLTVLGPFLTPDLKNPTKNLNSLLLLQLYLEN